MSIRRQTSRALRFHDLMWHRVSEVLLVSSPYDAFILEQDGQLTEQVFREYRDLSLPAAPRFTHAPTGEAALELLEIRRFDLVLAMTSLADMDVNAFGHEVKKARPGRPVVLLSLDRKELHDLWKNVDREAIDAAFLWTGDAKILLAIIKYVEDRENLDDVVHGHLKAILMVEDSPSYYSSFLGLLYHELTAQSFSLYSQGLNEIQRQMYMKARPRILHATSYEEGLELYEKYQRNVLTIICDAGIPRAGELDEKAGLDFIRLARRSNPDLPILLQSAEPKHRQAADEVEATFIEKGAHDLLEQIRDFLRSALGFGDFVFRGAEDREIGRAHDLRELEEKLATVPESSLVYHAGRNHFSIWLAARNELEMADKLRPKKVADFPTVEAFRQHLIGVMREAHLGSHRGLVADFSRRHFDQLSFMRLGEGSLGGKARGMAFLNWTLADLGPRDFGGLRVELPKTIVVTTEHFDQFLEANDLRRFAYTCDDDAELVRRFLAARLSGELMDELAFIVQELPVPLAVRSSSQLEDSLHQRLAGIYATLMLPNNAADLGVRAREISDAVKLVYASTFVRSAKSYLRATGKRAEEEKMAVVLQEVVGRRYGSRFYPSFSGVAQSFNFYPIGPQEPDDGIVHLALGFGRTVVDGGRALRFSPRHPEVLPQFSRTKSLLDRSQRGFYALDMDHEGCRVGDDLSLTLRYFGLDAAERDGTLKLAGSVFSPDDQQIRDDLGLPGPRVVTFNNILKHRAIPLPQALRKVLDLGREGLGSAVEVEFAGDMGDWGRTRRRGAPAAEPVLYLLQIRPFATRLRSTEGVRARFRRRDALCSSSLSLGNGVEEIHDLVYVRYDRWQAAANKAIAAEIGEINETLAAEDRSYLLIGPGRWGTADDNLGIPVRWSQISKAKVIVEASPKGYDVEPSQGTHFFQNITSLGIGYLSLPPGADRANRNQKDSLDRPWLDDQPHFQQTEHLRHLRFEKPLTVVLDGRSGRATIAKPGAERV